MCTNAELIFWILALISTITILHLSIRGALFRNPYSDCSIEDVESWNRNYAKIQRRYN